MSIVDRLREHKERHGPRSDVQPCPACGSGRTWTTGSFKPLGIQVKCAQCGYRGPTAQTRESAIALWNGLDRPAAETETDSKED